MIILKGACDVAVGELIYVNTLISLFLAKPSDISEPWKNAPQRKAACTDPAPPAAVLGRTLDNWMAVHAFPAGLALSTESCFTEPQSLADTSSGCYHWRFLLFSPRYHSWESNRVTK